MKMKHYIMMMVSLTSMTMMTMNESPMMMWIFMEISNIMFTMIFTLMQNNNINTPSLMMLIQFFSSTLILMSIIENNMNLMSLGISIKLGMFPAHSWMPMVIYMSPWKLNILTMTIPKIPPFMMMDIMMKNNLLLMLAILTSLISTLKLIKTNNNKVMMAFSSMIHSSWMILCQTISFKCWILYFTVYTMNILMMCMMLSMQTKSHPASMNKMMKLTTMMMMFSMMGTPPLTMFIGKMYLATLSNLNTTLTMMILILTSTVSIMYYSRIFMQMIYKQKSTNKMMMHKKMNKMMKLEWILYLMMLMMII